MVDREFFKQSRRENFDDSGSIRLTEVEQNAYRTVVTFEAVDLDGGRYFNTKTLPDNTHYGYATVFEGDSVVREVGVKYPLCRLSDTRNELLWHRYTTEELVDFIVQTSEATANATIEALSEATPDILEFAIQLFNPTSETGDRVYEWLLSLVSQPDDSQPPEQFTALPVDTPHPTVIKFKADLPMRFSLRLDSWFLANPVVYIFGSDVDSGEPTEGEGEYPDGGDTGNPDGGSYGDGGESELPTDSDPRDKDGSVVVAGLTVNARISGRFVGADCQPFDFSRNYQWANAGPPPYTLRTNTRPYGFTVCPGSPGQTTKRGFRLVASNGQESPDLAPSIALMEARLDNWAIFT